MNTPEREWVVSVRAIITSVPEDRQLKRSRPNSDLAFAFGKTQKTIRNIDKRVLERNNNPKRQQRSDAGITIFDAVKNQEAVFTLLHYYKKWKGLNHPGEIFDDKELAAELFLLPVQEQRQFEEGSQSFLEQSPYLSSEIGKFLRKTEGQITW